MSYNVENKNDIERISERNIEEANELLEE